MIRRSTGIYRDQPLYARMLCLRHVTPSGFLCFVFLEGSVALGFLLALAELVSWWGVFVLPITVAVMVKLNDVVAGVLTRPAGGRSELTKGDLALARAPTVDLRRPGRLVDPRAAGRRKGRRGVDRDIESRPAADLRGAERTVDLRGAERTVDLRKPKRPGAGGRPIDGVAVARTWTDELDLREQRARQSAARRYE